MSYCRSMAVSDNCRLDKIGGTKANISVTEVTLLQRGPAAYHKKALSRRC